MNAGCDAPSTTLLEVVKLGGAIGVGPGSKDGGLG